MVFPFLSYFKSIMLIIMLVEHVSVLCFFHIMFFFLKLAICTNMMLGYSNKEIEMMKVIMTNTRM